MLYLLVLFSILMVSIIVLANVFLNGFQWTYTDAPTHMDKLFFFAQEGYGARVTQWNYPLGYTLFQTYPPLFFFPALLIYQLLQSIHFSSSLAMAFEGMGILLALLILFFSKKWIFKKWDIALVWWGITFFNPLTINWIFESGRFPELSGWAVFTLLLAYWMRTWKDHPITHPPAWKKLLLTGILFALVMISHPGVFIMATLTWFALALSRSRREWISYAIAWGAGLIASAWWWIPYQLASRELNLAHYIGLQIVPSFIFGNALNLFSVALLIFVAWVLHKEKNPLRVSFMFLAAVGVLELSSALSHVPVLNQPQQQMFHSFFLFVGMWGLLSTRNHYPLIPNHDAPADVSSHTNQLLWKWVLVIALVVVVGLNAYSMQKFKSMSVNDSLQSKWGNELDILAPALQGPFACFPDCGSELSYLVATHGKTTVDNFSPEATPLVIDQWKRSLREKLSARQCDSVRALVGQIPAAFVLGRSPYCEAWNACGYPSSFHTTNWCVIPLPSGAEAPASNP
jgi:hypothetical protein